MNEYVYSQTTAATTVQCTTSFMIVMHISFLLFVVNSTNIQLLLLTKLVIRLGFRDMCSLEDVAAAYPLLDVVDHDKRKKLVNT